METESEYSPLVQKDARTTKAKVTREIIALLSSGNASGAAALQSAHADLFAAQRGEYDAVIGCEGVELNARNLTMRTMNGKSCGKMQLSRDKARALCKAILALFGE